MADETYTEWAARLRGDLGLHGTEAVFETGRDERLARLRVAAWKRKRPDVEVELLRREVTVSRDYWLVVDGG